MFFYPIEFLEEEAFSIAEMMASLPLTTMVNILYPINGSFTSYEDTNNCFSDPVEFNFLEQEVVLPSLASRLRQETEHAEQMHQKALFGDPDDEEEVLDPKERSLILMK